MMIVVMTPIPELLFILIFVVTVTLVFLLNPGKVPSSSPSPSPSSSSSPVRIGYAPRFVSKQLIEGSFKYIHNPLTDGSSGYLTLNDNSNMTQWNAKIPLSFTHAQFEDGKIFKFRRPNTSDTYGTVDANANIFMRFINLGTFS